MAAERRERKGAMYRAGGREFPAGRELAGNFINFSRRRQGIPQAAGAGAMLRRDGHDRFEA
jgi:hypothetical protein